MVPAAEGETFVRTHPRAHLPDAGAPPLLVRWLRPCSALNPAGELTALPQPVMWSETIGLRTDRSETKNIGLGLGGFVLCCEIQSCHARSHNDLGGHSSFSSTSCPVRAPGL